MKILIEVKGGVVQDVTVTNTNVDVYIVDYDENDPKITEFTTNYMTPTDFNENFL